MEFKPIESGVVYWMNIILIDPIAIWEVIQVTSELVMNAFTLILPFAISVDKTRIDSSTVSYIIDEGLTL